MKSITAIIAPALLLTALSTSSPAAAACYEQQFLEAHLDCSKDMTGNVSADFTSGCSAVPAGVYMVEVACPATPPTPAPPPAPATPPTPANCTLNGITRAHGQSATFYLESSVPFILTCKGVSRTCNNGTFGGNTSYRQPSCVVQAPKNCTSPWGSTVKHGTDIFAYPLSSLPHGYTCTPHKRSCWDGFLGGGGTYKTCTNK
jgi:hypothetical protein